MISVQLYPGSQPSETCCAICRVPSAFASTKKPLRVWGGAWPAARCRENDRRPRERLVVPRRQHTPTRTVSLSTQGICGARYRSRVATPRIQRGPAMMLPQTKNGSNCAHQGCALFIEAAPCLQRLRTTLGPERARPSRRDAPHRKSPPCSCSASEAGPLAVPPGTLLRSFHSIFF